MLFIRCDLRTLESPVPKSCYLRSSEDNMRSRPALSNSIPTPSSFKPVLFSLNLEQYIVNFDSYINTDNTLTSWDYWHDVLYDARLLGSKSKMYCNIHRLQKAKLGNIKWWRCFIRSTHFNITKKEMWTLRNHLLLVNFEHLSSPKLFIMVWYSGYAPMN